MCGIFGAVGSKGSAPPLTKAAAVRLRDTMAARGPDGAGLLMRGHVVFGHRRLAIRDPDAGRQPWLNEVRSVAVVYNGEIYNDGELRAELSRHGHLFRTQCDTELIPAAYAAWGTNFATHLRGDFAIGLYDFDRDRLLLVRDRCGAKPLFYSCISGKLVFSSTIGAIRNHPEFSAKPNWRAISHYLTTLRLTLGSETVFESIYTLQPGERLIYERGRIQISRYWAPPTEQADGDFAEAVESFESRLREAVRIRLTGDVPAGLFLSGGVDSTTLACIAGEESKAPLPAGCGTGIAENTSPCDSEFATVAAKSAGCELQQVKVGPDSYHEAWLQLLDSYVTPVSTPTDAILFRLSERMRISAGFVLGGEGADELLCGYSVQHHAGHDYDRWRRFDSGDWNPAPHVASLFRKSLWRAYRRDSFTSLADHYFSLNSLIPSHAKRHLLKEDIWIAADQDSQMRKEYEQQLDERPGRSAAESVLRMLHRTNLESLLSRLDSASMQAGLEVRPVFADHLLIEETFRQPESFKIAIASEESAGFLSATDLAARGSLRSKRLLRAAAEKMMPARLAHRPKASFPTPIHGWLGNQWSDWVRRTLRSSHFAAEMLSEAGRNDLATHPDQAGMWLWPVMNVVLWGDRHFCAA